LATVDGASWPLAAAVLLNDIFVDDIFIQGQIQQKLRFKF